MFKYMILMGVVVVSLIACADEEVAGPDITPPDAVTNFQAVIGGIGDMLIELEWDKSSDKEFGGYLLFRKQDAEMNYVFLDSVHTESYTDKVDSYTSEYSYEIRAYDEAGNISEGNSDAHTITSPNILPPYSIDTVNLVAKNGKYSKSIKVSWVAKNADVEYYNVIKETTGGTLTVGTKESFTVTGGATSFLDTSVVIGKPYIYSVQAVDFGKKGSTPDSTATDVVLAKSNLISPNAGIKVTTNAVTFTWDKVVNATSYELILTQTKQLLDTIIAPAVTSPMSITIDLSKVAGLQTGSEVEWDILTYSKPDGEINSSSDTPAVFTFK